MALFSDILLTVDFDRTLTAPDTTIPQRNLEAIRYFVDNGGSFTVNTGRSLPMMRHYMDILPYNAPLLLYNGSAAYDNGQFIDAIPIPQDQAEILSGLCRKFPELSLEVQGTDAHYAFQENPGWASYCTAQHCAYAFRTPDADLGPFLKFALYGKFRDQSVAQLFRDSPEEVAMIDRAEAYLQETYGDTLQLYRAAPLILDVHAHGVSKDRAGQNLKKRLGSKMLVCVGDAVNDLSMLYGADHAYCPADGVVADRFENVCVCAEGAVADVIYKKIPDLL